MHELGAVGDSDCDRPEPFGEHCRQKTKQIASRKHHRQLHYRVGKPNLDDSGISRVDGATLKALLGEALVRDATRTKATEDEPSTALQPISYAMNS
jgi:hypothetical protein